MVDNSNYVNASKNNQFKDDHDDEFLKDSLEGASPSQREFIEHERQIENNLMRPQ